jgi:hypothetical protein
MRGPQKTRFIHRERGDYDPLKTNGLYRGAEETNSSVRLLLSQKPPSRELSSFREGISRVATKNSRLPSSSMLLVPDQAAGQQF